MSNQTYRLNIEVQSDGAKRGVDGLKTSLNSLEKDTSKAGKALNELDNKTQLVSKSFQALKGFIGVLGLSVGIGSIIQTADSMQVLNDQVRLATGTAEKYGVAMQNIERIALSNRVSLQSVGEMYVSNERALKQLGKSQEEVIAFTENVTKAMRVGGGSAEGQAAALTQLGQALASGVLRGDEFNSIAEQAPMIMELMADSLNVTTGELRKMAGEGKLTAEAVYQALTSAEATQKLGSMTGQTATTVAGALQTVKNQWDIAVNKFMNGENGISQSLANIIIKFSDIIPKVVEFGQAFVGSEAWQVGIAGLGAAFEITKIAIENAIEALAPIGALITEHSDLVLALSTGLLAGATAYGAITLVMGAFATAGGIATAITTGLTAVTGALAGAMAVLTSPITLTAIAIGALVAAGVYLYKNWDTVKAKADEIWFAIGEIVANMVDNVTDKFNELKASATGKFNELKSSAQNAFNSLPAPVQTALRVIGNVFSTQFNLIKNVAQTVFNAIKALVRGDMEGVKTAISNGIQNAWNIVKTGVGNIAKEFANLGSKLWQAGSDAIQGLIDGISSRFNAVRAKVSEIAGLIPEGVRRFLDIRSPSRVMREIGAWAGEGFVLGVGDKVADAKQVAENLANALTSTVQDLHRQNFMLTNHANPLADLDYKLQFGELAELTDAQKTRVRELAQANLDLAKSNEVLANFNNEMAQLNRSLALLGIDSPIKQLEYDLANTTKYAGYTTEQIDSLKAKMLELEQAKALQGFNAELEKATLEMQKQEYLLKNIGDKYAGMRFDLAQKGYNHDQISQMVGIQERTDTISAFGRLQESLRDGKAFILPTFSGQGLQGAGNALAGGIKGMADLEKQYQEQLAVIKNARQAQLDINADYDKQEYDLKVAHEQAKRELTLSSAEGIASGLANATKSMLGEQSKAYRAMFAIEQGVAIARSVMAIQQAIAIASANPFPMNLGAMATVASQTMGIVAKIKAIKNPVVGQAHDGIMSVPKSGTWNLEKGERVLPKHTAKALDDKLNTMGGGGQTIIVNVTVNSDGTASVDSQAQRGKQMGEAIKVAVQQELIKQQKQGWLLYGR